MGVMRAFTPAFTGYGRGPQADLLVAAEAAGNRSRLSADEPVPVAHSPAQREAKVGVIAATDHAENALLVLDRRPLQDRTKARHFRFGVGWKPADHQFVMDPRHAATGDAAGD